MQWKPPAQRLTAEQLMAYGATQEEAAGGEEGEDDMDNDNEGDGEGEGGGGGNSEADVGTHNQSQQQQQHDQVQAQQQQQQLSTRPADEHAAGPKANVNNTTETLSSIAAHTDAEHTTEVLPPSSLTTAMHDTATVHADPATLTPAPDNAAIVDIVSQPAATASATDTTATTATAATAASDSEPKPRRDRASERAAKLAAKPPSFHLPSIMAATDAPLAALPEVTTHTLAMSRRAPVVLPPLIGVDAVLPPQSRDRKPRKYFESNFRRLK